MKATAIAPANIAFIKYWGKIDERWRLPTNGSVSVNLSGLKTTTTVEFSSEFKADEIIINGRKKEKEVKRVIYHLDRIRQLAKIKYKAKVVSENNFTIASGLASSASGFAALTIAAAKAAGLNLSEKELTILARLGSGSACRSIPDGFVEWKVGQKSEDSYAWSIFPPTHWDLLIIAVIVDKSEKEVASTDGHKLAFTSSFFNQRLKNINHKIFLIKDLIKEKKFRQFGELVEMEALELHAIMLTSNPSLIYWQPETIKMIKFVHRLRREGLSVYFTIDAGPHLFLICEKKNSSELINQLHNLSVVKKIIINQPAAGAKLVDNHLF